MICDQQGHRCFEQVQRDFSYLKDCNCLQDCDIVRYSYSVSPTAFDSEWYCREDQNGRLIAGASPPAMFMRAYEQAVNNKSINHADICREAVKRFAFVNVQMASQSVTRIMRDIRFSTADKLSTFGRRFFDGKLIFLLGWVTLFFKGGTMGLFTGMSILSFLELVFWSLRALSKIF